MWWRLLISYQACFFPRWWTCHPVHGCPVRPHFPAVTCVFVTKLSSKPGPVPATQRAPRLLEMEDSQYGRAWVPRWPHEKSCLLAQNTHPRILHELEINIFIFKPLYWEGGSSCYSSLGPPKTWDKLLYTTFPWLWIHWHPSSAGKESACNAGDLGSTLGLGRFHGEGKGYPLQYSWASLVAQLVKNLSAMQGTWVQSLCWEIPLDKGTVTHFSILAWRIPLSTESQRVGHDWVTFT